MKTIKNKINLANTIKKIHSKVLLKNSKVNNLKIKHIVGNFKYVKSIHSDILQRNKDKEPDMFCHQCAQTSEGKYCDTQSVCGKTPDQSKLQALLLNVSQTVAEYMFLLLSKNKLDESKYIENSKYLLDSSFSTLTNVNFDVNKTMIYIERLCEMRNDLKNIAKENGINIPERLEKNEMAFKKDLIYLTNEGKKKAIWNRFLEEPNADVFSLKELIKYGIKGVSAYFCHAERLRDYSIKNNLGEIYTEKERKEIFDGITDAWCSIGSTELGVNELFAKSLELGEVNLKVMKALSTAHSHVLGVPEPTPVKTVPEEGPAILVSGHDLLDLKTICELAEKAGVNVYTHGEMAPGHSYPEIKKLKSLKGHLGKAWFNQQSDFKKFKGAIILTSNCMMPPKNSYKDRIFTAGSVGFEGIPHLQDNEFNKLIEKALSTEAFNREYIEKTYPAEKHKDMLVGFGHQTILSLSDLVLNSIKQGKLKNIFLIGGCDGMEKKRDYFSDLTEETPNDSLILTLGCAKFKVINHDLGMIGDTNIPRVLDMGQCNDSYSAVIVALELAKALGTEFNNLPLHFAVSWFEQKAVAVLLTLLHLNVQNIRLGPIPPAFLTPNILKVLNEKFNLQIANHKDAKDDLKKMLQDKV